MTGRPLNESLAMAKLLGEKTYQGKSHKKCGTTERYTSSGACVECARERAAGIRGPSRKQIRAAAAEQAVEDNIPDPGMMKDIIEIEELTGIRLPEVWD